MEHTPYVFLLILFVMFQINHSQQAPVATPIGGLREGEVFNFQTSIDHGRATAPNNIGALISWGDGIVEQGTASISPNGKQIIVTGSHVYADDDTYTVGVTITGSDEYISTRAVSIVVDNEKPVIISLGKQIINEGQQFTFPSNLFNDKGTLDTHTGTVNWGDSTPIEIASVGEIPSGPPGNTAGTSGTFENKHVYADNKQYAVTITVTDDDGAMQTAMIDVEVKNVAPVVQAGADRVTIKNTQFCLLGVTFNDKGTLDTHTAAVDWGIIVGGNPGGTVTENPTGPPGNIAGATGTVTKCFPGYPADGLYTVSITVFDDEGASGVDSFSVTVTSGGPGNVSGGPDKNGNEGSPIVVGPITFEANEAGGHEIKINWADGTTEETLAAGANTGTHIYGDNGAYTVIVTVTSKSGKQGQDSVLVTVSNVAPTIDAGNNQVKQEGAFVLLAPATFTDAGSLDLHTATVNWGDGTPTDTAKVTENNVGPPGVAAGMNGIIEHGHRYADNGAFTVRVTVFDDEGASASGTFTVTVTNVAPTIEAGLNRAVVEGGSVALSPATFNDKGTLDTHTATINWGDGTNVVAGTVQETPSGPPGSISGTSGTISGSHIYVQDGTFTVTVTVRDDDNAQNSDTFTVTVSNAAPTINVGGNKVANEGAVFSLSYVTFNDVGKADPHTATINWGDGIVDNGAVADTAGTAGTIAGSHVYADNGAFTVTVTVFDEDNASATGSFIVTVSNVVPSLDVGSNRAVDEGTQISINVQFNDKGTLDTHTATINWGDGSTVANGDVQQTATGPPGSTQGNTGTITGDHIFADNGVFTVVVRVQDDDGGIKAESFTVTVSNVAPTFTVSNQNVAEGTTVSLPANLFNDKGTKDTHTGTIDWGEGGGPETAVVVETPTGPPGKAEGTTGRFSNTHVYADNGPYTVIIKIRDDDDGKNTKTITITVTNASPTLNVGPNKVAGEGSIVALTASTFNDKGTKDTHTATIDWGDGTAAATATVSEMPSGPPGNAAGTTGTIAGDHIYADEGVYTVTIEVTDDDNAKATGSFQATISNVAPTISVTNQNINEGDTVSLPGNLFNDKGTKDVHIGTVNWGEGAGTEAAVVVEAPSGPPGNTMGTTGKFTNTHLYANDGTYTVTIFVDDQDGGTNTKTFTVVAANVAPVVEAGNNQAINEGGTIALAPSTFTDVGKQDAHSATVNWGDGAVSPGGITEVIGTGTGSVAANHAYVTAGAYTVTVSVSDGKNTGQDSFVVSVSNAAIVVTAGANANVEEGELFSLAPATFVDLGGGTHTATINWGDGTAIEAGVVTDVAAGGSVAGSHIYADDGVYTVTVTVVDTTSSSSDSLLVTVRNVAPTITLLPNSNGFEGTMVSFSTSFNDKGTLDTHELLIDWGDTTGNLPGTVTQTASGPPGSAQGNTGTISGSHIYPDDGSFAVTVTLTDDNGGAKVVQLMEFSIANVAPQVIATDKAGQEGAIFELPSPLYQDVGTADIHVGFVEWGDGSGETAVIVTSPSTPGQGTFSNKHRYADDGTFVITITIQDDELSQTKSTINAIISNVAPTIVISDQAVLEGVSVGLPANMFTDMGSLDTHTGTVNWGDGAGPISAVVVEQPFSPATATGLKGTFSNKHVYADVGTYTVTVIVFDDNFGSATQTATITVSNQAPTVFAGADTTVAEGAVLTLATTFNDKGTLDLHTALINWGDTIVENGVVKETPFGPPGTTAGLTGTVEGSHVYADDASYVVTITVTDDHGAKQSDSFIVTVQNVEPTIEAGGNVNIQEGDTFAFSASFNDKGTADTHTASINWGDGTTTPANVHSTTSGPPGNQAGTSGTVTAAHVYADDGTYIVTVSITDDNGKTGTDTMQVIVANAAPTINVGPNQNKAEGDTVALATSFNDKGTLDTFMAKVNWGDGTPVEDGVVTANQFGPPGNAAGVTGTIAGSHVYADNGVYSVSVEVTDDNQGKITGTFIVTITNAAPTLNAGPDKFAEEGAIVTLTASSFNDKGTKDTHTATIDWGDGTATEDAVVQETPSGPPGNTAGITGTITSNHVYADEGAGTYTVTIEVTDDDGGKVTSTFTVTVSNVAPTVVVADQNVNEGDTVSLPANLYNDKGTIDEHRGNVNWGDGTGNEPAVVVETPTGPPGNTMGTTGTFTNTHVYANNGEYSVRVRVRDLDGARTVVTFKVTVSNVAPTLNVVAALPIKEGDSFSLSQVTFNDKGTLDVLSAVIEWGDTTTTNGIVNQQTSGPPGSTAGQSGTVIGNHVYADNGEYTVKITLKDDDNAQVVRSFTITVTNAAPTLDAGGSQTVNEGVVTSITSNFNDKGTKDVHNALITWGDGTQVAGTVASNPSGPPGKLEGNSGTITGAHIYSDNGIYTITVHVTDNSGASAVDSLTITVLNVAPTLTVANQNVEEGDVVSLPANLFNDKGTQDTHTGTVEWGDNTATEAAVVIESPSGPPGAAAGTSGKFTNTHVYADNGSYTVTITVIDDEGASKTTTFTVTVANALPTLVANSDKVVKEGDIVSLDPAVFNDKGTLDTHTATIAWGDTTQSAGTVGEATFGPPGSATGLSGTITGQHVYANDGDYTVKITLTDKDGATADTTFRVSVSNVAPTINPGPDQVVSEGVKVSLAPVSFNDKGTLDTHSATIDWGDNSPLVNPATVIETKSGPPGNAAGTTGTVTGDHVYADNGVFTVTIVVKDDGGLSVQGKITVTVNNVAPTIEAGDNQQVNEGFAVSLGPAKFNDKGTLDSHTAIIHWGDGSSTNKPKIAEQSTPIGNEAGIDGTIIADYVYADNGVYTVSIEVKDDDGAVATDSFVVVVLNVAPTLNPGGTQTVNEGAIVSLAPATFVDKGTLDTHTATINWGDGSAIADGIIKESPNGPPGKTTGTPGSITASHVYADNKSYIVTITLRDDDGAVVVGTFTVNVLNVAPTVVAGSNQIVNEGSEVSLHQTSFNDKGSLDTHTAIIIWGDTNQENGEVKETPTGPPGSTVGVSGTVLGTHTYADNGIYTVTIAVKDDDGAQAQDSLTITVLNVSPNVINFSPLVTFEGFATDFQATFNDAGALDKHGATIQWEKDLQQIEVTDFTRSASGVVGLVKANHVFDDDGKYKVAVSVTDNDSGTKTNQYEILVQNVAPEVVVHVKKNQKVLQGKEFVLPTTSFTDKGKFDTHFATVEWGEENGKKELAQIEEAIPSGNGVISASHTYYVAGTYSVNVTVTDNAGDSGFDDFNVVVENSPPTIVSLSASSTQAETKELVTILAEYSDFGKQNHAVLINWGDGVITNSASESIVTTIKHTATETTGQVLATHAYAEPGAFTISLAVVDELELQATSTLEVNIVAPTKEEQVTPIGPVGPVPNKKTLSPNSSPTPTPQPQPQPTTTPTPVVTPLPPSTQTTTLPTSSQCDLNTLTNCEPEPAVVTDAAEGKKLEFVHKGEVVASAEFGKGAVLPGHTINILPPVTQADSNGISTILSVEILDAAGQPSNIKQPVTLCFKTSKAITDDSCVAEQKANGEFECHENCPSELKPANDGSICDDVSHFSNFKVLFDGGDAVAGCGDDGEDWILGSLVNDIALIGSFLLLCLILVVLVILLGTFYQPLVKFSRGDEAYRIYLSRQTISAQKSSVIASPQDQTTLL